MIILTQGLIHATNIDDRNAFLDQDTYRALAWLRSNADGDDTVVFAEFNNGNLIPAWAPVRTTLGHWALTASAADRWDEPELVFDAATSHEERIAILRQLEVDYVYVDGAERELGNFDPASADYLHPVFESETTTIYRFQDNSANRTERESRPPESS